MNIGPLAPFIVVHLLLPLFLPLPLPLLLPLLLLLLLLLLVLVLVLLLLVCLFLKHPEQYLCTLSIKTLALGPPRPPNGLVSCPQSCHTHTSSCHTLLPLETDVCVQLVFNVGCDLARCWCRYRYRCAFDRPSTFFGQSKHTHTQTHLHKHTHTHTYTRAHIVHFAHMSF